MNPDSSSMIIVVGSGPAAVAAIHALVAQGRKVLVLDVGKQLEPDKKESVRKMSEVESSAWTKEDLENVSGTRTGERDAVHAKTAFGSSYCQEGEESPVAVEWWGGSGFSHSLAFGGLSNVWGAALLSYRQEDMAGWPITLNDLVPHYRAVMDFVPDTAVKDDLEEILPSYSTRSTPLEPSRQAKALFDDLERSRETLRKQGVHFGRSRLAIRAAGNDSHRACDYCARCLSGCPYGLIYSSSQTMEELIATGRVDYLPDHLVERVKDLGNEVSVRGRNLAGEQPFEFRAERVLIGAGVLPTAKIVLDSLGCHDRPVELKDSQYFIYPLLRTSGIPGVEGERMHTSAQAFVEIDDPSKSPHLVHLQIYGYSSFLLRELQKTFLRFPLANPGFREWFLGRLLVVQGYLHSRHSGVIRLRLKKTGEGTSVLEARAQPSARALVTVLKIGWKLLRLGFATRAWPIIPGLRLLSPGLSYHTGGSFPMSADPGELQTDTLGRLPSMKRVHLVDASVFPTLPATSVTFSVMANAHRIASLAGRLESP